MLVLELILSFIGFMAMTTLEERVKSSGNPKAEVLFHMSLISFCLAVIVFVIFAYQ